MMIDGDSAFPYVHVNIKVQIDGTPPPGWDRSVVEGKPDRQWTNTQPRCPFYYEHCPTDLQIKTEAETWAAKVLAEVHGPNSYGPEGTPKYPNYSDITVEIGEVKYDTWILDWFSHLTFDLGRSDEQLMDSFRRYVQRVQNEHGYGSDAAQGRLMGAEDHWRWKGDAKKGTPPPCRCDHCVKAGIVRIDH